LIHLYLTTPEVEDREFYGIYEEYSGDLFEPFGGVLEEYEDYNPAWLLRLPYGKDDLENETVIRAAVKAHYYELLRVRESIKEKMDEYKAMAAE